MLKLMLAFTFQLPLGGAGAPADGWIGPDKVKHFFVSAFAQSFTYGTLRSTGLAHGPSLAGASAVTLSLGAGKELWDSKGHGTPSVRDLAWDIAGAGTATVLLERTAR